MKQIRLSELWTPRWYQKAAWDYMTGGVIDPRGSDRKHAELIWHRRAGKDDVALNLAAREMLLNPANYWHMLPQSNQVRTAIWEAVNFHTGKRRIDEAFPDALFEKRNTDMFIRCKGNASTWKCMGSDNYESAIGSPPRGIVYSEWALANPTVRGYLRPIILENRGWQMFITTPRGKNHAYTTYEAAKKNPDAFAQKLTVYDTELFTYEQLMGELKEYVSTYGEEMGIALFEQELECSFEAAILGAIYGSEMRRVRADERVTTVPHNPNYPVHVAMDIGRTDDFAMWFFQVVGKEVHLIDYLAGAGKDPDQVCSLMTGREVAIDLIRKGDSTQIVVSRGADIPGLSFRQAYRWGKIGIPHDGRAKTFVAKGKTVEEQFAAVFGWDHISRVPNIGVQDGIQAARKMLARCVFDSKCEDGVAALESYHREWDDEKKMFSDKPSHDWASHPSDGFRYVAVMWDFDPTVGRKEEPRYDRTFDEMVSLNRRRRIASEN